MTSITQANFVIKHNQQRLDTEIVNRLQTIEFEEEINTISMVVLTFYIADFNQIGWKFLDMQTFRLGGEIELALGQQQPQCLFNGEIVSMEPCLNKNSCTLQVRAYDFLHRLRFGTKVKTFKKSKDSDLVKKIAGEYGLSAKTDATATVYPHLWQNNQSDFDFLQQQARAIRYEIAMDNKQLLFVKNREQNSPVATLTYLRDFYEFAARLSPCYVGEKTETRAWDSEQKKVIRGRADTSKAVAPMGAQKSGAKLSAEAFSVNATTSIVDRSVVDAGHAEALAVAAFNSGLMESVEGEGKCLGNPQLRCGKTIKIQGVGRFDGTYYLTATRHYYDRHGYLTYFRVRRSGV